MANRWDVDELIAKARAKEGVEDLGPTNFLQPLGVLTQAYAEAPLNDLGQLILGGGLVHSLRMRLRAVEWVRRHPEIREERIVAPIVVVGMMRSGTTLAQRLLASDARMQCVHGWEALEAAPPLDVDPTDTDSRIERGLSREQQTAEFMPDLFAIHPMHALEAEEEIVFLADAFLSHVPESGAEVPAYRTWLDDQDFSDAYAHLELMLQLLQWQRRQRGDFAPTGIAPRWVLKTPAHLGYLETLQARFPDLHLVHLHRDPQETIASGASLNATLHRMHADEDDVDPFRIGTQWLARMGWSNDRALASRSSWDVDGPGITDLGFTGLLGDPLGQISRVYADLGLDLTADGESSMRAWLARRPRPTGRPDYAASTFGLEADQIDERFSAYRERFGPLL